MKLSQSSRYALHAMVALAHESENGPVPSHEIARAQGIPERFLLKLLKPLVSAGVLNSLKGPSGGYRLARPANRITMLEIIEAVDGPIRLMSFSWNPTALDRKLETVLGQSAEWTRHHLGKIKLSELG